MGLWNVIFAGLVIAAQGYGYAGYGGYGYAHAPSPMPLFGPVPTAPYSPSPPPPPMSTAITAYVADQWPDGDHEDYRYEVTFENISDDVIYDAAVTVSNSSAVLAWWVAVWHPENSTFTMPSWIRDFGLYPNSKLPFGTITSSPVTFAQ